MAFDVGKYLQNIQMANINHQPTEKQYFFSSSFFSTSET